MITGVRSIQKEKCENDVDVLRDKLVTPISGVSLSFDDDRAVLVIADGKGSELASVQSIDNSHDEAVHVRLSQ